jgi:hypothetical protein
VHGGDGGLELVRARPPTPQRGLHEREPFVDPVAVPAAAVLVLEQHQRAVRIVAALPADRWDDPSACSEWSNRDVLGHVVWGQHLVRHLATSVPYACDAGAPGAPNPGS